MERDKKERFKPRDMQDVKKTEERLMTPAKKKQNKTSIKRTDTWRKKRTKIY
jgi:hypothetical protein